MFSTLKSYPRVGKVEIIEVLKSLSGSDMLNTIFSKFRELIFVKILPVIGAINRNREIKIENNTARVINAAIPLGIEKPLILKEVSLSIKGFPISEITADIIIYSRISLKYHAINPIIRVTAIAIMYLAS
jgi:hypothetical protein